MIIITLALAPCAEIVPAIPCIKMAIPVLHRSCSTRFGNSSSQSLPSWLYITVHGMQQNWHRSPPGPSHSVQPVFGPAGLRIEDFELLAEEGRVMLTGVVMVVGASIYKMYRYSGSGLLSSDVLFQRSAFLVTSLHGVCDSYQQVSGVNNPISRPKLYWRRGALRSSSDI